MRARKDLRQSELAYLTQDAAGRGGGNGEEAPIRAGEQVERIEAEACTDARIRADWLGPRGPALDDADGPGKGGV